MRRTAMLTLCAILCLPLAAQEQQQEATSLRQVDVTARRRLLRDTGVQQTVLDSLQLRDNISLSMADILTRHTTLFVKSYGRATESTAEFRGTSPSHTQVTWNGMRINSPMLGTVDFSTLPAFFTDRARLLHGASSILHTGGGLGGAIALETLPVPDGRRQEAQFVQGVGQWRTFDEFARLTLAGSKWQSDTRLSYATSQNDFHYINPDKKEDVRDEEGNIISSYHPRERNRSGYFTDVHAMQQLRYNDGKGNRMGIASWYSNLVRGLPFLSVDYKDDSDFTNECGQHTLRTVADWRHSAARQTTTLRAGHTWQRIAYDYTTTRQHTQTDITHSLSVAQSGFVQGEALYMPSDAWQIEAQLQATYSHVRSNDYSPFHQGDNYCRGRMEYALGAQARWRPVERMGLAVALRQEVYASDWVPLIPALFADWLLSRKWQLAAKLSVARNYRYPTLDDLYFKPGGNSALRPERGITWDAGMEWDRRWRRGGFSGGLTVFDSHISDWILWTPNVKGFWQPANVKRVHNYGVEATLTGRLVPGHGWRLQATANYAYTPSINRGDPAGDNDQSYGRQLCYVPRHSANAALTADWHTWTLAAGWTYYSRRFTTTSNETAHITGSLMPYHRADLSLEKRWKWRRVSGSVKAQVNNLLDNHYMTVLSRPMAGRNYAVYLSINPRWK